MVRYAAAMLALLVIVGCQGTEEFEYGDEEEGGLWGDDEVEPRYGYGEPVADWPAVEYVYAGEWGKHGPGKGEFQYPQYIAVAPDGTVYVADSVVSDIKDRIRIQYFDPSGTYLGEWGTSVAGIAAAPNGNVYVNDPWTAIKCFTRTGSFLGERRISRREYIEDLPEGLAVAPNGNVYVACDGNGRIKYYTPGLKFLGGWGSEGDADGQFHTPGTVAVAPNGWVYVNDRGNRRIQYFTPDGSFVGQKRFLYKPFHAPVDVAVAPNGHLYLADAGNYRVAHLDADGKVLGTWGHEGSGDGEFRGMSGIAVGPNGDVYVVDYVNDCVQRFNAAGSFIGRWGTLGKKPGQFERPYDVAVSPRGVVYVADTYNCRIQYFTADGSFLGTWNRSGWHLGPWWIPTRRLHMPASVAVAPNGDVYVLHISGTWERCSRFTATGSYLGTPYYRGGLSGERCPYGYVAVAPNGTFAVGDAYGSYVRYFTSNGSLLDTWNLRTGGEDIYEETRGLFLNGLAFAPNGNVFVTDIRFDRLRCFTATGSFLGAVGERPAQDAAGGDVVDLTVGPEGDLYVCHGYDDVVARYSPSGEVMAAWGGSTRSWLTDGPPEPGLFDFPCAIAVAADGTVYVVDRDNNRVQYFRPRAEREEE